MADYNIFDTYSEWEVLDKLRNYSFHIVREENELKVYFEINSEYDPSLEEISIIAGLFRIPEENCILFNDNEDNEIVKGYLVYKERDEQE